LEKFEMGFGQHLMLDGYGCPYDNLTDLDRIYEFLNQCPDLIHMTKIMPPYAFKYSGKVPQDQYSHLSRERVFEHRRFLL
jgi:S-adenosylmethionine decarboxylase